MFDERGALHRVAMQAFRQIILGWRVWGCWVFSVLYISLLQLLLPSPFVPFLNFYQVSLLQLHFNLNSQDSSSSSAFDGIIDAQLFDDVCILKSVLSSTGELPCPHQRLLLQIQTVFMSLVHPSFLTFSASDCLQHSLSHLRCTSALNSRHLVFGSSSQPPPSGSIPSLSSVHLTTPNLPTGANRQRHRASPALCFRRKSRRQTRRFMSAEKVSPLPHSAACAALCWLYFCAVDIMTSQSSCWFAPGVAVHR